MDLYSIRNQRTSQKNGVLTNSGSDGTQRLKLSQILNLTDREKARQYGKTLEPAQAPYI